VTDFWIFCVVGSGIGHDFEGLSDLRVIRSGFFVARMTSETKFLCPSSVLENTLHTDEKLGMAPLRRKI